MCWNQRRQAQGRLVCSGLRQLARRKLRIIRQPTDRRSQRRENRTSNPAHLRRERWRDPSVPGQYADRSGCVQRRQTNEEGGCGSSSRHEQRHGRDVLGTQWKLTDDLLRRYSVGKPRGQHQDADRQRDQTDTEKSQSGHSATKRNLVSCQSKPPSWLSGAAGDSVLPGRPT